MSALKSILLQEIATHGPMSLASYMQRALTDPQHGYYMQRRPSVHRMLMAATSSPHLK